MQDKSFYHFATDTDPELDDWMKVLKKVVQSNESISLSVQKLKEQGNYWNMVYVEWGIIKLYFLKHSYEQMI